MIKFINCLHHTCVFDDRQDNQALPGE